MDETHSIDGHFRQQSDFCGGLGATLDGYQTVQRLTRQTSHKRFEALLKRTNVSADKFDQLYPEHGATSGHSQLGILRLEDFYTELRMVGIVVNFFYTDYLTFQIKLPDFALSALEHLSSSGDPHALPPNKYDMLKRFTTEGILRPLA